MIVIEFILKLIARFFIEIIFEGLILGALRLLVLGKPEHQNDPLGLLEKKFLYKKIGNYSPQKYTRQTQSLKRDTAYYPKA